MLLSEGQMSDYKGTPLMLRTIPKPTFCSAIKAMIAATVIFSEF